MGIVRPLIVLRDCNMVGARHRGCMITTCYFRKGSYFWPSLQGRIISQAYIVNINAPTSCADNTIPVIQNEAYTSTNTVTAPRLQLERRLFIHGGDVVRIQKDNNGEHHSPCEPRPFFLGPVMGEMSGEGEEEKWL